MGNYNKAVCLLERAAANLPTDPAPHYWLGHVLLRLGRTKQGKRELAEVGKINGATRERKIERLSRMPSDTSGN